MKKTEEFLRRCQTAGIDEKQAASKVRGASLEATEEFIESLIPLVALEILPPEAEGRGLVSIRLRFC
jgi:hypothetical protein